MVTACSVQGEERKEGYFNWFEVFLSWRGGGLCN
jgi:hypothetical protein